MYLSNPDRSLWKKDSNRPEFFGTVPKSSTMSQSPKIHAPSRDLQEKELRKGFNYM